MVMQPVPSTHLDHWNDLQLLAKSPKGISKDSLIQYVQEMTEILGSSDRVEHDAIIVLLHGQSNGIHIVIANL